MDIYEFEKELKIKMNNSADDTIRFALLETLPPIADYSCAVDILKDNYSKYKDFRMAVLITFLVSTWENYRKNDFINELNSFFEGGDNEQRAIIYYLNAYDILMHNEIMYNKKEYTELLNKSVDLDTRFVYNYYRLAQILNRKKAKKLMEKAMRNIEKVYSDNECENMKICELIEFEVFLKEKVLGTNLTQVNYMQIKGFYDNL